MRRPEYRFVVSAVDRGCVQWDVAHTRDPLAALAVAETYRQETGHSPVWVTDLDAVDVDCSGTVHDTDDPLVERWLREQPDSTLIGIAAGKHGVNFYDGDYGAGGDWLDREFVIEFLLCDGKVGA